MRIDSLHMVQWSDAVDKYNLKNSKSVHYIHQTTVESDKMFRHAIPPKEQMKQSK